MAAVEDVSLVPAMAGTEYFLKQQRHWYWQHPHVIFTSAPKRVWWRDAALFGAGLAEEWLQRWNLHEYLKVDSQILNRYHVSQSS